VTAGEGYATLPLPPVGGGAPARMASVRVSCAAHPAASFESPLNTPRVSRMVYLRRRGGVTERPMVTVLKTVFAQANVGSNPTPSATCLSQEPVTTPCPLSASSFRTLLPAYSRARWTGPCAVRQPGVFINRIPASVPRHTTIPGRLLQQKPRHSPARPGNQQHTCSTKPRFRFSQMNEERVRDPGRGCNDPIRGTAHIRR
jgi:hypothetical protein